MQNIQCNKKARNAFTAVLFLGGAFCVLAPSPAFSQTTRATQGNNPDLRPLEGNVEVDPTGRLIEPETRPDEGAPRATDNFRERDPRFRRFGRGPRGFRVGPDPGAGNEWGGPEDNPQGPGSGRGPGDFGRGRPGGRGFGPGGGRGPRGGMFGGGPGPGMFGGGPRGGWGEPAPQGGPRPDDEGMGFGRRGGPRDGRGPQDGPPFRGGGQRDYF